jgi:hypothetical protein
VAAEPEENVEADRTNAVPGALVMAAGDLVVFILFALVGRSSHHESESGAILPAVKVASPFIAGWLVGGSALRAYGLRARSGLGPLLRRTLFAWFAGCLIGLGIRSLGEHRIVPVSFAVVAFTFNAVVLLAWRLALFWWTRSGGAAQ